MYMILHGDSKDYYLIDYQIWLDPTLEWCCRIRHMSKDMLWFTGGTLDQLIDNTTAAISSLQASRK